MARRPRLTTRGERLRKARKRKFSSARAAAIAFGIPVSTYGAHERAQANGGRDYGPNEARRYAELLGIPGVTTEWLLTGYQPPLRPRLYTIRIHGFVGPGGEVHIIDPAGEWLASAQVPKLVTPKTVALRIIDDILGVTFVNWVLLYEDLRWRLQPALMGEMCAVGMSDRRILIGLLAPGTSPERCDLITRAKEPLRDLEPQWVVPVKAVVQAPPPSEKEKAMLARLTTFIPPAP
jgi:hypothetical protein